MAISILTFQDEPDGTVSVDFKTDPLVLTEEQQLSDSQLLGLMFFHQSIQELDAEFETADSSG